MTENEAPRELTDTAAATGSIVYLLISLGIFGWLLFDTWIDAHHLPHLLGYKSDLLQDPLFHLVANTVIGGAIGGIVNGIRSALTYYSAFNRQYFWKYIAAPWMGSALALIGFALLRSTIAIFGGDAANGAVADTPQNLANFAIGALAGYGSKDVFVWLDEQVNKLFKVEKPAPDVTGKSPSAAAEKMHKENVALGNMDTVPAKTSQEEGKVIDQDPKAGAMIGSGESMNIVVADSNGKKPAANRKKPPKKSS